jgi:hypothetical protein
MITQIEAKRLAVTALTSGALPSAPVSIRPAIGGLIRAFFIDAGGER